jgi:hypothetical protein
LCPSSGRYLDSSTHSLTSVLTDLSAANAVLPLNLARNKKFWKELIAYFPLIRHGPHTKESVQNASIVARVFAAAVTFSPAGFLANARGYEYRLMGATVLDLGVMMYMQSIIKTDSDICKLIR